MRATLHRPAVHCMGMHPSFCTAAVARWTDHAAGFLTPGPVNPSESFDSHHRRGRILDGLGRTQHNGSSNTGYLRPSVLPIFEQGFLVGVCCPFIPSVPVASAFEAPSFHECWLHWVPPMPQEPALPLWVRPYEVLVTMSPTLNESSNSHSHRTLTPPAHCWPCRHRPGCQSSLGAVHP